MQVSPLTPTTHTPPDGRSRSPVTNNKITRRYVQLRIEHIGELLSQIDALVPQLSDAHLGRLEGETLGPMLKKLEHNRDTLVKWNERLGRCVQREPDQLELSGVNN